MFMGRDRVRLIKSFFLQLTRGVGVYDPVRYEPE